jgi:hypothetical protein
MRVREEGLSVLRSNHRDAGGEALIPWVLAVAILVLAGSSCTNDASVSLPTSNPTTAASGELRCLGWGNPYSEAS